MRGRISAALLALLASTTSLEAKPALEPDAQASPAGGTAGGGTPAPATATTGASSASPSATVRSASPAPSQVLSAKAPTPLLRGLDLDLTVADYSGIAAAPDAYENLLSFLFEPHYTLGKQLWKRGWGRTLTLGGRIGLESELSGNDPLYRGSDFGSSELFRDVPEQLIINGQQPPTSPGGRVSGAEHRLHLTDLALSVAQGRAAAIPHVGELELGVRVVLPTSLESQVAGLYAAPSLFAGVTRKVGRYGFEYGARAVKYLFASTVSPISHLSGTVDINGQPVQPTEFPNDGKMNPNFGFTNSLSFTADLPRDLGLEVDYSFINTFMYNPTACGVPGVPTANVCSDGKLLGDVRGGRHDSEIFSLEANYKATSWGQLALGLYTFQPMRKPDGEIANPFVRITRDNFTTVYLSFVVNAEALASAAKSKWGSR